MPLKCSTNITLIYIHLYNSDRHGHRCGSRSHRGSSYRFRCRHHCSLSRLLYADRGHRPLLLGWGWRLGVISLCTSRHTWFLFRFPFSFLWWCCRGCGSWSFLLLGTFGQFANFISNEKRATCEISLMKSEWFICILFSVYLSHSACSVFLCHIQE